MQGVYSSVNTRKLMALRVVNSDVMAAFPSSTCSVLTTDSLAIKPEISAVAWLCALLVRLAAVALF